MISVVSINNKLMQHLFGSSPKDINTHGRWILMRACLYLEVCGELRWSDLHRITQGLDSQGKSFVEDNIKLDDGNTHPMSVIYNFKAPRSWIAQWAFTDPEKRKAMEAAFNLAVENTVRDYIEPEIARCRLKDGAEVPASILAARVNHSTNSEGKRDYHTHVLFPFSAVSPDKKIYQLVLNNFSDRRLDAGAYFDLALEYTSAKIGIYFSRPLDANGKLKHDNPNYYWILDNAVARCSARGASFQRKDVFREAFHFAQGQGGINPLFVYTRLSHDLQHSTIFIDRGISNGVQWYSVEWVRNLNMDFTGSLVDFHTMSSFQPLPEKIIQNVVDKNRRIGFSQSITLASKTSNVLANEDHNNEKKLACIRYATQSPSKIKLIYGMNDNAKMTIAAAIAEAYQNAGYKTLSLSPSNITAEKFSKMTGIESDTISHALYHASSATDYPQKHDTQRYVKTVNDLGNSLRNRLTLDKNTVLFVDHASRVTLSEYTFLTNLCSRSDTTMILLGDDKRLPAKERETPFCSVIDCIGGFDLRTANLQESAMKPEEDRLLNRRNMITTHSATHFEGEKTNVQSRPRTREPSSLQQTEQTSPKILAASKKEPPADRHTKKRGLTLKLEPEN